jgi:hypothetical protein
VQGGYVVIKILGGFNLITIKRLRRFYGLEDHSCVDI